MPTTLADVESPGLKRTQRGSMVLSQIHITTLHLTFRTIPPLGQGSIQVQHQVTRELLEKGEPGESYRVKLYMPCYARRWWWVFGDLNGDLKDKKFWDGETEVDHEGWAASALDEDEDDDDEDGGVDIVFAEGHSEVIFEVVA
ncbi:MAG: hypothetical protein M1835_006363 [Candelina submexicana]|nr:MAG: hypothetical protein M1835_006363 [Candelina submexicana]